MQKTDLLIRTKLHLPFTQPGLVSRPRLQEQIAHGLCGPLTLITAPAGFGKTTLVASCVADCGMPIAWLSLDKDDNQAERFLNYLVAALQKADNSIGIEAAQLMAASPQAPLEAVLTSLINDLDTAGEEIVLVLDDYQFISSQAAHEAVAFILRHCPKSFHLMIATRSDPPLPLARLRARGQTVQLRAADLRFTVSEATQFLNDGMGLHLEAGSVAVLEERTEGWIAGLQMAALSMRNREDVIGFIEGFSGTNRYILDYLLEEVMAGQPAEVQRFLLYTSILERLIAPLCDAVMANGEEAKGESDERSGRSESAFIGQSASMQEYLERANLFLVPLDDEKTWYRYHHLFADLLRTQLLRSLGVQGVAQLHIRASEWHEQNGSILEAINHASMASDDERVERLIVQNYMEMLGRGEMSWMRFWKGKLSKELVYGRPVLCIYLAQSHAWFGELDEADLLLDEAEKHIRSENSAPKALSMSGHLAYVRSRVTAMRGENRRALELCLSARDNTPDSDLGNQLAIGVALGYEFFLNGDFTDAVKTLQETIRVGRAAMNINVVVGAYCVMARLLAVQGLLSKSYDTYQEALQFIPGVSGQHLGAKALVEVGIAAVLCEWNDLDDAMLHMQQGLAQLSLWGKADDFALAYITLARIHLAHTNTSDALEALEKAIQFIKTRGVFSEARNAVEITRSKLWLVQGDIQATNRWVATQEERFGSDDLFGYKNELTHIAQVRVLIAQNKPKEAINLLSHLVETARSAGRSGRVVEILLLEALTLQEMGDSEHAILALTECLTLAEPGGYMRIFLDEGQQMQMLLAQWLAHTSSGPVRDYSIRLLSQFDVELKTKKTAQEKTSPADTLVEPLSQRELEVLHLMALGKTNQEIAEQLIVARGTIKAHTANIYRKLDVANRTEAVARARQLGILP
jgi:LuxR family maltose regulon positive regulatory protein